MNTRTFPGMYALRLPLFAPEDDDGAEVETQEAETTEEEAEPQEEEAETEAAEADAPVEVAEAAEGAAEGEPEEEAEPKPARKDWKVRQVEKAKRERDEATQRAKALEERLKSLEELYAKPEGERDEGEIARIRQEAREEAKREVRAEEHVSRLNKAGDAMFDAGAAKYPKTWNARVNQVGEIFGDEFAKRLDIFEIVTDFDNGPDVWHDLSGDLDRVEDLLAMPPHKAAVELTRLSEKLKAPALKPRSAAPPPIKPLEKRVVDELPLDDDRVSQEEFNRRRAAQEAKRYG